MANLLTVIIVDENEVFRTGLKQIIGTTNQAVTLECADSTTSFTSLLHYVQPGLIFLRVKKNAPEDMELIANVTSRYPLTKIITLYEVAEENFVQQLFHQKIQGIIHKNAYAREFMAALDVVVQDGLYYCQQTLKLLASSSSYNQNKFTGALELASFTPREKQIITLLCQECTAKEIADKLALSKRTIENMKMRIQEKMQAKNIAGIVSYAYRYSVVKNLF
jgi:DNA-binding NarL/FixJ family response regulator